MGTVKHIPDITNHDDLGPKFPRSFVDQQEGGWNRYDKKIIRLMDISATGTEINLGECGEIALYSDIPLNVSLGNSGVFYADRTEFRMKGRIDKLIVHTPPGKIGLWAGRLVIYIGRPELGISFERERWQDRIAMDCDANVVWAAAAIINVATIFIADGVAGAASVLGNIRWAEAGYLRSFYFQRSAGTINSLRYIESETGGARQLVEVANEVPGDCFSHYFDTPPRMTGPGDLSLTGSNEAATTLAGHALITGI